MTQLINDTIERRGLARAAFTITAIVAVAFSSSTFAGTGADATDAKCDVEAEATLKMEAADGMPKPDELFERYIKAIGGEEAILKNTSMTASGRWLMPAMGMEGSFKIYASEPNYFLMELNAPGMGTIRSAYTGDIGWNTGELTGTSLMEEGELADMKIDADFRYPLTFREHFSKLKTVAKTTFAGEECYHVQATRRTGDEISIYFSADSGMLKGSSGVRTSEHGEMMIESVYSDFEEIDGVKVPKLMKLQMPDLGITQHFHMDEITHNQVDPSVFEPPAAIKRLIERKKKEAAERDANDAADA